MLRGSPAGPLSGHQDRSAGPAVGMSLGRCSADPLALQPDGELLTQRHDGSSPNGLQCPDGWRPEGWRSDAHPDYPKAP